MIPSASIRVHLRLFNVFPALLLIILSIGGIPETATAAGSEMQTEIAFLLDRIEQTECWLIRNGKAYSGAEAAAHVKAKYRYFADRIDSAETFIELSASRSTLTGRAYEISCPGHPKVSSVQWLKELLDGYRSRPEPLTNGAEPGRSVHQNADKH